MENSKLLELNIGEKFPDSKHFSENPITFFREGYLLLVIQGEWWAEKELDEIQNNKFDVSLLEHNCIHGLILKYQAMIFDFYFNFCLLPKNTKDELIKHFHHYEDGTGMFMPLYIIDENSVILAKRSFNLSCDMSNRIVDLIHIQYENPNGEYLEKEYSGNIDDFLLANCLSSMLNYSTITTEIGAESKNPKKYS